MTRKTTILAIVLATSLLALVQPAPAAQPTRMTYQGVLVRDGVPFNGDTRFKFAIVDSGATLWSLDGTSVGGSEPEQSLSVLLQEGLFSFDLGAPVPGREPLMTPLTADDLAGATAPRLVVWVESAAGVFEVLSDEPLSSAPFAMASDSAERALGDFSVEGGLSVGGTLQVSGGVIAGTFTGDGSGLTNVPTGDLAPGTYSNTYAFVNTGNTFVGNGVGLTGVVAQDLVTGTHGNAYDFSNPANTYRGDGSALTGVQSSGLAPGVYPGAYNFSNPANVFTGSGAGLVDVAAATLADGDHPGTYVFENENNVFVGDGSRLAGIVAEDLAGGVHGGIHQFTNPANVFTGDGSGLTGVSTGGLLDGNYGGSYQFTNPANVFAGDGSGLTGLSNWGMSGNAGTDPATEYLGTSDFQPFEIRVDGRRALRLQPTVNQPSLVGGSAANQVDPGLEGSVIAGGGGDGPDGHLVESNFATIGGGLGNRVGIDVVTGLPPDFGTVAGGRTNQAAGYASSVSGGANNVAEGEYSLVAGGEGNRAAGRASAVLGGQGSEAQADYSLAAGRGANAVDAGAIVLADGSDVLFWSEAPDEFAVRASGGVRLVSAIDGAGAPLSGVVLAPGAGSWSALSDVAAKENFLALDGEQLLARLREVPVSTWNYRTQDPTIRHAGPMAQDFRRAFGLGQDERHINAMDMAGVNMAAIKVLDARTRALQDARLELEALRAEIAELKAENGRLDARLARLEALIRE